MGIYLSTPSTEISLEDGQSETVAYCVAEMQGWRKNMEDAHVAITSLPCRAAANVAVFGVFDGHGGKEVAKFCNLKYPEVLLGLESFQSGDFEKALFESFKRIDEMLEDMQYDELLKELRKIPNPSDIRDRKGMSHLRSLLRHLPTPSTPSPTTSDDDEKEDEKDDIPISREAVELIRRILAGKGPNRTRKAEAVEEDEEEKDDGAVQDSFSHMHVESTELWRQTSPEAAVTPVSDEHHVSPHVSHIPVDAEEEERAAEAPSVILLEDAPPGMEIKGEATPAAAMPPSDGICRLPPHRLAVATGNAGDSRAVLSRAGQALALSEDHKPALESEAKRIKDGGGFVNFAGRVNGNLNLSRSLGDLKYKQNKQISWEAQIISGAPEMRRIVLNEDGNEADDLLILACDGVWDVLSCQDAVDSIRSPWLSGQSLNTILCDVLKRCLADDPRKAQGIGADNMTCLVVQLRNPPPKQEAEVRMEESTDEM
eukprot:gene30852-37283_t